MDFLVLVGSILVGLCFMAETAADTAALQPRRTCRRDRDHRFIVVEDLSRRCVKGCHHLRGRRVVCDHCGTVGEVWDEPETAAVLFDVAPRGGVYR